MHVHALSSRVGRRFPDPDAPESEWDISSRISRHATGWSEMNLLRDPAHRSPAKATFPTPRVAASLIPGAARSTNTRMWGNGSTEPGLFDHRAGGGPDRSGRHRAAVQRGRRGGWRDHRAGRRGVARRRRSWSTCPATPSDVAHSESITKAIAALDGFSVRKVSDRTFLLHLGGKIEVNPKVPLKHRDDLSRAYTPGVARVCLAIAENPADARRLTIKRNTVAVVTDGSAVLGLGNIGPAAALPVMEGQGGAVQAVRRGRRLAGLPGHPGLRRDRDDRQGDRPGLRRGQPGGHLRAALLRDRGAAARRAGHPGLPR